MNHPEETNSGGAEDLNSEKFSVCVVKAGLASKGTRNRRVAYAHGDCIFGRNGGRADRHN